MIQDTHSNLNQRIADNVKQLRARQRLSLDSLATKSGVSRSMISLVERGETSPTAVVLGKLATGLNIPLASLFAAPGEEDQPASPVARRKDQQEWRDPATGYLRRILSPPGVQQPMQIVEVEFPPGQRVAFEPAPAENRVHKQLWVLEGTMEVTVGKECFRLREGDCLAMNYGLLFYNPTRKWARYIVVVTSETPKRR